MTLGRTSSGAIKIKTDPAGGGLRAVECACCGVESGYYSGGGYYCSDGSVHPVFGPQVDYWGALAFKDGDKYVAEAWSVMSAFRWEKIVPAGTSFDYSGPWTLVDTYRGPSPPATATFSLSQGADPRCPNANQKSLIFNVQVQILAAKWTNNGLEDCGGIIPFDVYACWQTT